MPAPQITHDPVLLLRVLWRSAFGVTLAVLTACISQSQSEDLPGGGIRTDNLARHLSILASDEFEGPTDDTRTVYRLAADLAGRKEWPTWGQDSACYTIREQCVGGRNKIK